MKLENGEIEDTESYVGVENDNILYSVLDLFVITYCTLLNRKVLESRKVELILLYSLGKAKTDSEFYRTLIMNTLGAAIGTVSYVLHEKVYNKGA
jgi:hypothetical protein